MAMLSRLASAYSQLNYNICEKRTGVVPKALSLVVTKRLRYKRLKEEVTDPKTQGDYDNRQVALKWILVTCFGYLGYRNSKFGTIDGHIGVAHLVGMRFLGLLGL